MGPEGTWLVDQNHPGYDGCVKKAIEIARKDGKNDMIDKYSKLPPGTHKKKIKPAEKLADDTAEKQG